MMWPVRLEVMLEICAGCPSSSSAHLLGAVAGQMLYSHILVQLAGFMASKQDVRREAAILQRVS